jgi:hypothetical protein
VEQRYNYVPPPSFREGFYRMVKSYPGLRDKYVMQTKAAVTLNGHPFGLELPSDEQRAMRRRVVLVADPGTTDSSVDNMSAMLQMAVERSSARDSVSRLIEYKIGDNGCHKILFEAWTSYGVFICGGCTDCSGAGGQGTFAMRSVFLHLSLVYGLHLEVLQTTREEAARYLTAEARQTGLTWAVN